MLEIGLREVTEIYFILLLVGIQLLKVLGLYGEVCKLQLVDLDSRGDLYVGVGVIWEGLEEFGVGRGGQFYFHVATTDFKFLFLSI